MPSKFRPIMLLGLGEYGSIIAQEIFSSLDEKDKNLSQIISCLTFNESGVFSDFKTKKNIFTCDGLNPDLNSLKFKENYEIIQKYESEFESVLSESIDNIRNQEIKSRLRTDYEIEDTISLFIFSSLSDTLGSISIVLFLYYINRLFTERFNAVQIEKNVFGFFPDLFNDYKSNNYAYARSYACLQELDFLGDNPTHILSQGFLYDYIYLFTESNEKGESIGTYKDMIPMITEVLFSLLTGEITSENLDMTHINNVEGKTPRYNSFGLTKLIFPIDNIMKGITDFLTYNFLNHKISNKNYELIENEEDIDKWLNEAEESGEIAVDTETSSLDPHQAKLVGISFSTKIGKACYIPIGHTKGKNLEEKKVIKKIKPVFIWRPLNRAVLLSQENSSTLFFSFYLFGRLLLFPAG